MPAEVALIRAVSAADLGDTHIKSGLFRDSKMLTGAYQTAPFPPD